LIYLSTKTKHFRLPPQKKHNTNKNKKTQKTNHTNKSPQPPPSWGGGDHACGLQPTEGIPSVCVFWIDARRGGDPGTRGGGGDGLGGPGARKVFSWGEVSLPERSLVLFSFGELSFRGFVTGGEVVRAILR